MDVVGPAQAKFLLYSGQRIDAAEAARIGLVNRVVADEASRGDGREPRAHHRRQRPALDPRGQARDRRAKTRHGGSRRRLRRASTAPTTARAGPRSPPSGRRASRVGRWPAQGAAARRAGAAALLGTGFLLGWSVAWPPGPINAEIARRCLARGFWAGFGLLLGACSGDALWAVLVSLGVGALFTLPAIRLAMGVVSVGLLLALAAVFLRGAWRGLRMRRPARRRRRASTAAARGFLLGMGMALSSPWNVAFWLAAIGRPELARHGTVALLTVAAAVLAGALTWGVLWSGAVVLLRRRAPAAGGRAAGGRWA